MTESSIHRKIRAKIGKAISDFAMISPEDHVVVGLSGGKDSLLLLTALGEIRTWSPVKFQVSACSLDITGGTWDTSDLADLCSGMGIAYRVIVCPMEDIIRQRDERSPCSFCANMRRGILNSAVKEMGGNTLALGHNLDDAIETAMMNLCRTGRFRSFKPKIWQSDSHIKLIRPLVYTAEKAVYDEVGRLGLPILGHTCPFSLNTERSRTKELLRELKVKFPEIRENILHALKTVDIQDRWDTGAKN